MVNTIKASGLKLALWHTPYLAATAQPMRAEADLNGYFPPQQGTWLNRWSPPLDFTKPEAAPCSAAMMDFSSCATRGGASSRQAW